MAGRRQEGYLWEQKAAEYLKQKGYRVVASNFYSRYGEIDLIVRDREYLVFVEVKYRKTSRGGHPLETVDAGKQKRICRTADRFCCRYGYSEHTPCRFDVIGMTDQEIVHIENAFSYWK